MNFAKTGVHNISENGLRTKVILSNRLAVLLSFIPMIFSLLTYLYFPSLVWIPLLGLTCFLSTLLFNYLGLHTIARFVLCTAPIFVGQLFYAALSQGDHDPLMGIKINIFGFLILPFILFDTRELTALLITFFVSVGIFMAYPVFNHYIHFPIDNEILKDLEWFAVLFGTMVIAVSLLSMVQISSRNLLKTQSAMQQMRESNEALNQNKQQLQQVLNEVEQARAEDKRREWAIRGQARVSQIFREYQHSEQLFQQVIGSVANHLHAQQAALYIKQDARIDETQTPQEISLELIACYACPEDKLREKNISSNETLVGQCFYEGRSIHIKKLPPNYISKIQSGLGSSPPTSLLLVPIKRENQSEGVIEIASFHSLDEHKQEFLEQLAENLASSLANSRLNRQTQQLLKNAQQQSEDMAKKQATIEALKTRTELLLNNVEGIIFLYKKEGKQWKLEFINQAVERLLGYEAQDFIDGKITREELVPEAQRAQFEQELQKTILQALQTKKPYHITYNVSDTNGNTRRMLERGNFIFDEAGKISHCEGLIIELIS